MTKSTITRERVQWLHDAATEFASTKLKMTMKPDEVLALTRALLAAMDSEHHTDDELSNLLWYSQEATCHSDPNYYCEFQRLATPGFIASIIRELQERRKADSEPVAWLLSGGGAKNVVCFDSGNAYADPLREVTPLYRHAQPAPEYPEVLPCSVLLEPGLRFGKGIKTSTMLAALARRAVHESDLAALSPEEKAEFQARIEDFKALIAQPAPVVPEKCPAEIRDLISSHTDALFNDDDAQEIWNACRAAMLQAQPQNAQQNIPEIIPGGLVEAVNNLLNNDGSRGCYDAMECNAARVKIELWLAQRQRCEGQRKTNLSAGNSSVIPESWQVEAEKLAEMHGMSFVLFRHGEAPQCADPTKVVISFTDKGLGHDTLPAAHQEVKGE